MWTTGVNLTRPVTLQGQTTVTGDHTTNNYVVNDRTIIVDGATTSNAAGRMVSMVNPSTTQVQRLTGITFSGVGGHPGFLTYQLMDIGGNLDTAGHLSKLYRLDHIHFTSIARDPLMGVWSHGLCDHFVSDHHVSSAQWRVNNKIGLNGDEEFAAPAGYGTDQFWVFEDVHIDNKSLGNRNGAGGTDRENGGRLIWRYSFLEDVEIVCHGTYAARRRGGRAGEEYGNVYFNDQQTTMDGITSGSTVYHDNQFTGIKPTGWSLQDYRTFSNTDASWGAAGGQNPFDVNVTEPDGSHIDGHPSFVFYAGTIASVSHGTDSQTITVSGAPWITNQFAVGNYCAVSNPDTPGVNGTVGLITANTGNALTMFEYTIGNHAFAAGNTVKIYRLLGPALDQPGMGQGDLITGNVPTPQAWPHQQIEPCYSWNNVFVPDGSHINFAPRDNTSGICKQGVHFFNDTVKPGYTPLVYPHPLVSGQARSTKAAARPSRR